MQINTTSGDINLNVSSIASTTFSEIIFGQERNTTTFDDHTSERHRRRLVSFNHGDRDSIRSIVSPARASRLFLLTAFTFQPSTIRVISARSPSSALLSLPSYYKSEDNDGAFKPQQGDIWPLLLDCINLSQIPASRYPVESISLSL